MRKAQKREILEIINSLHQLHEEIKNMLEQKNVAAVQKMISDAQETAIFLGEYIEKAEGEGHATVSAIEEYCEALFCVFEDAIKNDFNINKVNKGYKILRRQLIKVENSVKNDIAVRLEIVFLPYKASMWDSLESIYLAAKDDPDCDAYCVPIPYYDLNPDHSFGQMHYEGGEYPEDIEITDWQEYNFEERKPDVIYIHNPYDMWNLVTSVHPRFYSSNLKKYTDTLVYVPYYVTSGTMMEAQGLLPSYQYVDYIVIQSPEFRKYFDESIPDEKFLPFGSPKIDRVIRKCQNPPEPPEEWAEKMKKEDDGRKRVIFYNTGINAMLADTGAFLKKMEYVFRCFMGREDVCLLWRPHPLLESTFDSLRPEFRPVYDALKRVFLENNLGIYDTTADIEDSIAWSDAYIGDAGTSVVALFGVAGKPIFILDNQIHILPRDDDWRGEKISLSFDPCENDKYQLTANNQLWFSENNDYHYKFYMDLACEYSGNYYMRAVEIGDSVYVIPCNAQNLLIIKDKIIRKIELKKQVMTAGAFSGCLYNDRYIFLLPGKYPQVIRFDIRTEEIRYIDGIKQFYMREINGNQLQSGCRICGNEIIFGSPADCEFMFMDIDTLAIRYLKSGSKHNLGTLGIIQDPYGNDLWIVPLKGMIITRWNPETGETREYSGLPEDFRAIRGPEEIECDERPFGMLAFSRESGKENIVISPAWGNMYLSLDRESGKIESWDSPVGAATRGKNGYFPAGGVGGFIVSRQQQGKAKCRLWHAPERKLYEINIDTKEYREIKIEFDYDELREHESGFADRSEWSHYCLVESAFNSLKDFLDNKITGKNFDKKRQIDSYAKINANLAGTCGEMIHGFIKSMEK
ncbi:MAG: hypothetical protein NC434_02160 [Ruminococcus sp.]|nr:hypothetical protein [Ruminococcus sp.]